MSKADELKRSKEKRDQGVQAAREAGFSERHQPFAHATSELLKMKGKTPTRSAVREALTSFYPFLRESGEAG